MPSVSCVICAYNEAERIGSVLRAVVGHPLFDEVLVVDDGSADQTAACMRAFPGVRLVRNRTNRGKTYALARGARAARGDLLMALDADLAGLDSAALSALAAPVLGGRADVSFSLRRNSLPLYRLMGLDFVSGERLLPRRLLADSAPAMMRLPRWGGEVFMNDLIIERGLRVAVVDWRAVSHARKAHKVGAVRGMIAEFSMIGDAVRVLTPAGVVRQNLELLKLAHGRRAA